MILDEVIQILVKRSNGKSEILNFVVIHGIPISSPSVYSRLEADTGGDGTAPQTTPC